MKAAAVSDLVFTAVDFESLPARDGTGDMPVQIGLATLEAGAIGSCFESRLRPPVAVVAGPGGVHGITAEQLSNAPALLDVWPEIETRCRNKWIVAHGAGTERRFLRAFPFHGFGPWVDTLALARALYPDLESHALGDLVNAFDLVGEVAAIHPGASWHDALFDAIGSLVLLRVFLGHMDDAAPEELLKPSQAAYHRHRRSGATNPNFQGI